MNNWRRFVSSRRRSTANGIMRLHRSDNRLIYLCATPKVTRTILEHLSEQECKRIVGVVAMLGNTDSTPELPEEITLVVGESVSLGQPTADMIAIATKEETYFEIDPYTLDPVPPRGTLNLEMEQFRRRIRPLVEAGAFRQGHLLHSGHHHEIFFSLEHMLQTPATRDELIRWLHGEIVAVATRAGTNQVAFVYPYRSPIHILVDAILRRYPDRTMGSITFDVMVAKPVELTGARMGYIIDSTCGQKSLSSYHAAVFLDDGVATGGTLASVLDALLDANINEIASLIVFDRIGLQPRRHLRRVRSYAKSSSARPTPRRATPKIDATFSVNFQYRPYLTANIPTFFRNNCPQCRTLEALKRLPNDPGLIGDYVDTMSRMVQRTVLGARSPSTMNELDTNDLLEMLTFRNAVFSDKASPRDIRESLTKHTDAPVVKRDKLLVVLRDRKLHRQVALDPFLENEIVGVIASTAMPAEARAYFVLSLASIADAHFAAHAVRRVLPKAFTERAQAVAGSQRISLDSYFARYMLEFAAIGAALHSLAGSLESEDEVEEWLGDWRGALGETTAGSSRSVFGVELQRLLLPSSEAKAAAVHYLVTNFRGSYSSHDKSLNIILQQFRQALRQGNAADAVTTMPPALFRTFIAYVTFTGELFVRNGFSEGDLAALTDLYGTVESGAIPEDFERLLRALVLTDRSDEPSKLDTMLNEAAPQITDVVNELREVIKNRKCDCTALRYEVPDEAGASGALFGRERLLEVLSNFVLNAFAWRDNHPGVNENLSIVVSVQLENAAAQVTFEVADNNPSSREELDASWNQDGGLSANRYRAEQCNAQMGSAKRADGWTVYYLTTSAVKLIHTEDVTHANDSPAVL